MQRAGEMRQIDGLSLLRQVTFVLHEHVDGMQHRVDARVGEEAEILVTLVAHAHRGLHDQAVDRLPVAVVGVDSDEARSQRRDSARVRCIQEAHRPFLDQVDHGLLSLVDGVVRRQGRDSDVSAYGLVRNAQGNELRCRKPRLGGSVGKVAPGPVDPALVEVS